MCSFFLFNIKENKKNKIILKVIWGDYLINYIWFFMIGSGLIVSLINGSGEKITKAITDSTSSTVTFVISLVGIMCLWCGIMKIAEESGLTNKISKILKPILKILFKEKNNEKVMGPVVMNLTANILGLGNAATPFGIKAMEELDVVNEKKGLLLMIWHFFWC